ncbi:putative teichuronic acid biosynthesis glycosyltransferase TuaH [Betaproteobacteria bacterium MOLA814]|nr:putative teichuronic acid biosynthesis glycosyltransferase TuaH [Betaproteobacteria bacterium MOLA814]
MKKTTRTSIVVLCYNSLKEATRPCLESIIFNTPVDSYELIVVDNASSDGTADYLKDFGAQHANVRIQLNDTNKGYAGGNNDGIKLARGQYIVLLNNDTLVPSGWLDSLIKVFSEQPDVGLVGPVTNAAGNEQRIELRGLNEKNFEKTAAAYVERQKGVWFTTEKLGFFCVAMRRTLTEKIGYLDEKFGIGMFEDDDYCIRAKKAGFFLAVAEDCFVYHKGSVSFNKLSVEIYREQFEKNKTYFKEKHEIEWTLTDIAFCYWDKFDKDLSAYVKNNKKGSPEIERISIRLENFKHLLVQIHRVELSSMFSNTREISSHPVAIHAKWQTRWQNFMRNMVHGTSVEKYRYFRSLSGRVIQRFSQKQGVQIPQAVFYKLHAIRETLNGRKLIIFPATVDFHYMTQRPQHLARAFAEAGYVVIYGTLNNQVDKVEITEQVATNLYLLNEHYFPFISYVFKPAETTYYCLWPNNIKHLEYLTYSYLLYDYMDDLSLLELSSSELENDHQKILNQANLVTVSADILMSQLPKHILPKSLLLNNAVSDEFIDTVNASNINLIDQVTLSSHPILGYYGAIAEWLDFDLIECLAKELPNSKIVLIGPVSECVSKRVADILWNYSNVVVLPPCKQLELIPFLKRFDICLIPFIRNDITNAISPVKLFEYLSAGKPVVTTNLAECVKYTLLHIANDHHQFVDLVRNILSAYPMKLDVLAQQLALDNTWKQRVQQIRLKMEQ